MICNFRQFFFFLVMLISLSANAQVYTVTNTTDAGVGSLRYGIETAVPGTSIYFDPGIAGQTIVLGSIIVVPNSVFIYGQNNNMTISGGGTTGLFNVDGTYDFQVYNLTLSNGSASNGGVLYAANGALVVMQDVILSNNLASNDGGAIRGISANFTFKNCQFIANQCGFFGGAHSQVFGSCTMENVLFSGNKAGSGGAAYLRCTANLRGITFAGNFANNFGGAIFMYNNSPIDLYNSIAYNNATSSNPAGTLEAFVEIDNGTTNNMAIQNSLIQGSGGSGSWINTFGFDSGGNIDFDPLFVNQVAPSSAPTNSGDYHTMPGSPAQDVGANALSSLASDADGHPRIVNGTVDMGAFEFCTTYATANVNVCYTYNSPGGNVYNASGTYLDTIANMMGCDSVITTILSVNTTYNTLNETHCESYTSPSGLYTWTSSGAYQDTILNMAGCDSVLTINLTINYNTINTISPVACGSYLVPSGSYSITSTGTYNDTIPNTIGCDSILTINATINSPTTGFDIVTECYSYVSPSGNYTWTGSGSYMDTIPNSAGCDSVITIQLTIYGTQFDSVSVVQCTSFTSPSGLYTWTSSGVYNDTLSNIQGCDSIIVIDLTIINPTYSTINPVDCFSYTSPSGNYTWVSSGIYSDTLSNTLGCDSIITINLTIPNGQSTIDTLICSPYLSPSGTYTWDQAGTYIDTVSSSLGCDSVITINISVLDANDFLYFDGATLSSDFVSGSFSWIYCDSALIISDVNSFIPDLPADYALVVDNGLCIDTSACVGVNKDYTSLTGFSPNGDGVNDVLKLPIVDDNNTVSIFNRWGDEIITIDGYNNFDVVWDGTDKSGNIVSGTYYYVISGSVTRVGWVQLLK